MATKVRRAHKAYAIEESGERVAIDARSIVIELADGVVEIDLADREGILAGLLRVDLVRGGFLRIGPGDGGSTFLGPHKVRRRRAKR